ncbi:MAG: hypothetical protein ACXAB7_21775 [Candidatus Kariarchaeaceae archaeon]|jgi:hypothetical protein
MTETIVYILGAGSTKAFEKSAPLAGELLRDVERLFNTERGREAQVFQVGENRTNFDTAYSYLSDFMRSYEFNWENNDLEELLTFIDLSLMNPDINGTDQKIELHKAKRCVEILISILLESKLRRISSNLATDFASYLIRSLEHNENREIIIINLNYDLVLENTLQRKSIRLGYGINYHEVRVDIVNAVFPFPPMNSDDVQFRKASSGQVMVLKPHGSLNWLVCKNCNSTFIVKGRKVAHLQLFSNLEAELEKGITRCYNCKNYDLEPLIITPTTAKNLDQYQIPFIWTQMEEYLTKASYIRIIGYSLPMADKEFRTMLRTALIRNKKLNITYPELIIIDGSRPLEGRGSINLKESEKWKKYHSFFGEILTQSINRLGDKGFWIYGFQEFFSEFLPSQRSTLEYNDQSRYWF